jgi:hypothetical protein
MPTRIEVNLATGETTEIELVGEELATYQASLAQQALEAQQAEALAAQQVAEALVAQQVTTPSEGAPNGNNT